MAVFQVGEDQGVDIRSRESSQWRQKFKVYRRVAGQTDWINLGQFKPGHGFRSGSFGAVMEYRIVGFYHGFIRRNYDEKGKQWRKHKERVRDNGTTVRILFDDGWGDGDYNDLVVSCSRFRDVSIAVDEETLSLSEQEMVRFRFDCVPPADQPPA
jgi:hypothetical protein